MVGGSPRGDQRAGKRMVTMITPIKAGLDLLTREIADGHGGGDRDSHRERCATTTVVITFLFVPTAHLGIYGHQVT